MKHFNDIWLRGQAAQQSILQLAAYNAVVLGTASVQAMRLGLNAPLTFWDAVVRTSATPVPVPAAPPQARRSDRSEP